MTEEKMIDEVLQKYKNDQYFMEVVRPYVLNEINMARLDAKLRALDGDDNDRREED